MILAREQLKAVDGLTLAIATKDAGIRPARLPHEIGVEYEGAMGVSWFRLVGEQPDANGRTAGWFYRAIESPEQSLYLTRS